MNDTLIFLLLAGIALIFKLISGQGAAGTAPPKSPTGRAPNDPPARTPLPGAPAASDEEKVRRFLEALGAPPGSRPPPPVQPKTVAPRREITPAPTVARKTRTKPKRSWAQPLPPLVTRPEESLSPSVTVPEPQLPAAPVPARAFVRPRPVPERSATAAPSFSLGEMLRSPGSARQAMILREVLGPPRGLQAIDFAGGRPF